MRTHFTFIAFALVILVSCSKNKDTASGTPKSGDSSLEPDQIKPKVDTRFQELFFQAQLQKSKGEIEKAYKSFLECLAISPDEPAVNYEVARIERSVFMNATAAAPRIKKSIEQAPKNAWYHRLQGEIYMDLAKFDLAAKSFKLCYEYNPNDQNALYDQASALIAANKIKEAIAVYDELEKNVGVYEELSYRKHEMFVQLGDMDRAGEELEKLAAANPMEARYWGVVAQFYSRSNKPEKAKVALEKMVKADPENGLVHYQLSEFYAMEGDDKRSFEELKKAFGTTDLVIDQKIMVLMKYYQLTETNANFIPQAYELIDIMIGVNKSEAKAYSIKGDFLYRDARDNEALAAFTKAIELDATKSQLWEQTLSIQLSLGKYAELVQYGERATSLFPNNPMFYLYYGFGLERSNKTEDAIYQFNIGKELVIENPLLLAQFYSSLGSAYNKIKDHVKSDEAYDKALVFNPNDAFTLNNYAYYLSLRKVKLEKAAIMSKQAVDREPSNPSFLDTYSWILFQQQKYTEALIWIEKTIQYDPKPSGEVLEHYGDILYKNGNVQGAVDKWMAAQEVGGGSDKLINKITSKSLE